MGQWKREGLTWEEGSGMEIWDFKVTVIKARFEDQKGFAGSLNPASRWQLMAFLSSPFFLCWVPSATSHATPELMTQP